MQCSMPQAMPPWGPELGIAKHRGAPRGRQACMWRTMADGEISHALQRVQVLFDSSAEAPWGGRANCACPQVPAKVLLPWTGTLSWGKGWLLCCAGLLPRAICSGRAVVRNTAVIEIMHHAFGRCKHAPPERNTTRLAVPMSALYVESCAAQVLRASLTADASNLQDCTQSEPLLRKSAAPCAMVQCRQEQPCRPPAPLSQAAPLPPLQVFDPSVSQAIAHAAPLPQQHVQQHTAASCTFGAAFTHTSLCR